MRQKAHGLRAVLSVSEPNAATKWTAQSCHEFGQCPQDGARRSEVTLWHAQLSANDASDKDRAAMGIQRKSRSHFLAMASTMMQCIFVNHELARRAQKRDVEMVNVKRDGVPARAWLQRSLNAAN